MSAAVTYASASGSQTTTPSRQKNLCLRFSASNHENCAALTPSSEPDLQAHQMRQLEKIFPHLMRQFEPTDVMHLLRARGTFSAHDSAGVLAQANRQCRVQKFVGILVTKKSWWGPFVDALICGGKPRLAEMVLEAIHHPDGKLSRCNALVTQSQLVCRSESAPADKRLADMAVMATTQVVPDSSKTCSSDLHVSDSDRTAVTKKVSDVNKILNYDEPMRSSGIGHNSESYDGQMDANQNRHDLAIKLSPERHTNTNTNDDKDLMYAINTSARSSSMSSLVAMRQLGPLYEEPEVESVLGMEESSGSPNMQKPITPEIIVSDADDVNDDLHNAENEVIQLQLHAVC